MNEGVIKSVYKRLNDLIKATWGVSDQNQNSISWFLRLLIHCYTRHFYIMDLKKKKKEDIPMSL